MKFILALCLSFSLALAALSGQKSQAEAWSDAVTHFITDPQLYREIPKSRIKLRFLPLVPPQKIKIDGGQGVGSNSQTGVLFMLTNLQSNSLDRGGIEQIEFVLKRADDVGTELYPLLRTKLLSRLQKPAWNLKVDGKMYFWRKGASNRIVSLDLHDFHTVEMALPGPGPFVIVTAALEEGDSEESPEDKPANPHRS